MIVTILAIKRNNQNNHSHNNHISQNFRILVTSKHKNHTCNVRQYEYIQCLNEHDQYLFSIGYMILLEMMHVAAELAVLFLPGDVRGTVQSVPPDCGAPQPALSTFETCRLACLGFAKRHPRRRVSLNAGKQLDVHLEWGSATSGGASATADCEAVWRCLGISIVHASCDG